MKIPSITYINFKSYYDRDVIDEYLQDRRIATLQTRLGHENMPDIALLYACQINLSISNYNNESYVRQSYRIIMEKMGFIFSSNKSAEVKRETVTGLICVGEVIKNFSQIHFDNYYAFLRSGLSHSTTGSFYIRALSQEFETISCSLEEKAFDGIIEDIKIELEKSEPSSKTVDLVDLLHVISNVKPSLFANHFFDVVDILVGCLIDHNKSTRLSYTVTKTFNEWSSLWLLDVSFSISLLESFSNDIENLTQDLMKNSSSSASKYLKNIINLLQIFNTILSAIYGKPGVLLSNLDAWTEKIFECLQRVQLECSCFSETLLICGQRTFLILLKDDGTLNAKVEKKVFKIIQEFTLNHLDEFTFRGKELSLKFIGKVFNYSNSSQQAIIAKDVLNCEFMMDITFSVDSSLKMSFIRLFSILLNSKNVLVMQDVYSYLVKLLESSLSDSNNCYSPKEGNTLLLYILGSFCNLISPNGSVLSKWALDPPIFTLLADAEQIVDPEWIRKEPLRHSSLLRALYLHSNFNDNFIRTSSLNPSASSSHTSNFYERILEILKALIDLKENFEYRNAPVLVWTKKIIQAHCKMGIRNSTQFSNLIDSVLRYLTFRHDPKLVQSFLQPMDMLLNCFMLREDQMDLLYKVAVLHMRNKSSFVRELCFELICKISSSLGTRDKVYLEKESSMKNKFLAQYQGEISGVDFKFLFSRLFQKLPEENELMLNSDCLRRNFSSRTSIESFVKEGAVHNQELYSFWQSFEVAWFAIANKLKTPLGKAQDLLTTIEKQIRLQVQSPDVKLSHSLLGFFDIFERMLINSCSGGSAFHIKVPSKTALSFFTANVKTCTDWIKRLRPSLVALAFKVNAFDFVIRTCNEALFLLEEGSSQNDMETMVIYLGVALFKKGLPYHLKGLYTWTKKNTKMDGKWILALIDLGNQKTDGLLRLIESKSPLDDIIQQTFAEEISFAQYQNKVRSYYSQSNETYYCGSQSSWEALVEAFDSSKPLCEPKSEPRLLLLETLSQLSHVAGLSLSSTYVNDFYKTLTEIKGSIQRLLQLNLNSSSDAETLLLLKSMHNEYMLRNSFEYSFLHAMPIMQESLSLKTLVAFKDWADLFTGCYGLPPPGSIDKADNLAFTIARRSIDAGNFPLALKTLGGLLGIRGQEEDVLEYSSHYDFSKSFISIKEIKCFKEIASVANCLNNKLLSCNLLTGSIMNIIQSQSNDYFEVNALVADLMHDLAIFKKQTLQDDVANGTYSISDILLSGNHFIDSSVCELIPHNSVDPNFMEIGFLLKNAVSLSSDVEKYWGTFGDWAFELGEQVLQSEMKGSIRESDKEILHQFNIPPDILEKLCQMLSNPKFQTKSAIDMTKREFMEGQLRELLGPEFSELHKILNVWLDIQKRMYFYFELSLFSYFQQISLSSSQEKVISATLRILHMIVKYSLELEEPLEKGLSVTPCRQWIPIIPQLFSRLNHPIRLVRNKLIELLSRLSKENAQSIIYPAIVGSLTKGKLPGMHLEQEEKEEDSDKSLQNAHIQIVNNIRSECPDYDVDEILSLVIELQRISLLWDELWSATLQQYSNEVNQRAMKLEREILKHRHNEAFQENELKKLFHEKFNITFKPFVYVLEKIMQITSTPETMNELSFTKKYGGAIGDLLDSLKNPKDTFAPVQLLKALQGKLPGKLYRYHFLSMKEISSVLAKFKDVKVPMPGLLSDKNVLINSFHGILTTLATKTKPKKLWILGSDGKRYGYLLKGLEDLHLDERIMQFLSITNHMRHREEGVKARTYAVVPLGIRSGLIQWVKKAIPVFSLHKKWQQRKQNATEGGPKSALQNPSDIFYSKLFPLLREKGITNLDSRKKWPDSVLREVYETLSTETPNDLITREIYFASHSSRDWHSKINNLTKSIAIMSTIGYIIGLGDRHLDNLLIDFVAGEIIHIDYNVCFEKGKNLSIPERVPCRLTQNIIKVFGAPGVHGAFKYYCEDVLRSLRQGCDTLINLLEAFVYDPLVDWTPGVDNLLAQNVHDTKHKKDLQTEIMFSMYCVRITEIESAWMENKYTFIDYLSKMDNSLDLWLESDAALKTLNQDLSDMHVAMSLLKDAESNPRHKLFLSKSLYNDFHETKRLETLVSEIMESLLASVEKQGNLIQRTYSTMSSSQVDKWHHGLGFSLSAPIISGILDKYVSVKVNVFNRLTKMEEGYTSCVTSLREELEEALGALKNYSQIISPLYSATKKNHILFAAADILTNLSSNELSIESLNKAKNVIASSSHYLDKDRLPYIKAVMDKLNQDWTREAHHLHSTSKKEAELGGNENASLDSKNDPLHGSKTAEVMCCLHGVILPCVDSPGLMSKLDEMTVAYNVLINMDQMGCPLSESEEDLSIVKNTKVLLNGINTFKYTTLFSVFFEASHLFIKDKNSLLDTQKELRDFTESHNLKSFLMQLREKDLCEKSLIQECLEVESQLKPLWEIIKTHSPIFANMNSSLLQMEKLYLDPGDPRVRLISFIERLLAMESYVTLCIRYSLGFMGESSSIPSLRDVFDSMDPFFRNIIHHYLRRLGRASLKNLLVKGEDVKEVSHGIKSTFSAFQTHMKRMHHQHCAKIRSDLYKDCKNQVISFTWLHDGYVDEQPEGNDLMILKKYMKTLPLKFNKYTRISKEYEEFQKHQEGLPSNGDIRQELKKYWKAHDKRGEALSSLSFVYKSIFSSLNGIHLNESLRNAKSEESIKLRDDLSNLLEDCLSLNKSKEKLRDVASHEIKLYSMNEPLGEIDLEWIKATSLIVSERVKNIQSELIELNQKLSTTQGTFEEAQRHFRDTFSGHQRLMTDVSVLLQSLNDSEDYEIPRVKAYLSLYKEFSGFVSQIAEKCSFSDSSVEKIMQTIAVLKGYMSQIYDELISLANVLRDENIGYYKVKRDVLLDRTEQDRKVEEERNSFAINVLRRVRSKLEGKEPDPLCQVSVPDQVDFFIKEATSSAHLSQMYEGWMAWI